MVTRRTLTRRSAIRGTIKDSGRTRLRPLLRAAPFLRHSTRTAAAERRRTGLIIGAALPRRFITGSRRRQVSSQRRAATRPGETSFHHVRSACGGGGLYT
jgi:hypothetical protein